MKSSQTDRLECQIGLRFQLLLLLGEDVPKTQCLIPRTCYYCSPIRVHREIKNTECMACQCLYFLHLRHSPYIYLVEGVPVSAYKLVNSFREHQIANLGTHIKAFCLLPRDRVPKPYGPVRCATPGNQQSMLVRRPSECLHCRCVLHKTCGWVGRVETPNVETVIISS
jgi:hypothetical protein